MSRPPTTRSHSGVEPATSCAVVLSDALGDSVMMMALAHKLALSGHAPTVFGRIAEQLADWYPWCRVRRTADRVDLPLAAFDIVVELYPSALGASLGRRGRSVALASLPGFRRPGDSMLDCILRAGCGYLGIEQVVRSTGIVVPPEVVLARQAHRVVIHPTASHPEKAWSRRRFVDLARRLTERGLSPSFIVPPGEGDAWHDEAQHGTPVHAFASLADVAAWMASAGWFIGNDSGPGHLASALGVPTVSLFMRRGLARTWRPGWAPGRVVLPTSVLPGAWLRERLWQRLLPVGRVVSAFESLRLEVEAAPGTLAAASGAPRAIEHGTG